MARLLSRQEDGQGASRKGIAFLILDGPFEAPRLNVLRSRPRRIDCTMPSRARGRERHDEAALIIGRMKHEEKGRAAVDQAGQTVTRVVPIGNASGRRKPGDIGLCVETYLTEHAVLSSERRSCPG